MDETMLTLKTGVTLIEQEGQFGLVLHGRTQFAKNPRQTEILQALTEQPLSPESLMALLRARDGPQNENENSLAIAGFILDFGDYIKA